MVRSPLRGEQLSLLLEVPAYPIVNPTQGKPSLTVSSRGIVIHRKEVGREQLLWADYDSGIPQPHVSEPLLPPEQLPPPEPCHPRRHSPKGKASGWIEERVGNRKRKIPSLSYYYRWQDETGRHSRYIPAGKFWRVQQMVEVERRSIGEVLEVLLVSKGQSELQ